MRRQRWRYFVFFTLINTACCLGVLPGPNFVGQIKNLTVTSGRDASLTCKVENLRGYKVAWIQVDTQTILTIHDTVITRNPRIGLSREDHNVYTLHLKDVHEEDRGWYMCQINTDPMIKNTGFLQVVVPPDFEDSTWPGDLVVREGTNVSLECRAKGYPPPTVSWRREDPFDATGQGKEVWEGTTLHLEKVSRLHMGAYLCVAANGIQPTISKRVQLRVQFPPMLWIPNQLEGADWGGEAALECNTEAYPRSINYWTNHRGEMIAESSKYLIEVKDKNYKTLMKLTIYNLTDEDFTQYRCIAKNSLGETDGSIKLYEIRGKPADFDDKKNKPKLILTGTDSHLGNEEGQTTPDDTSFLNNHSSREKGLYHKSNYTKYSREWGRNHPPPWRGSGTNDVYSEKQDKRPKKNEREQSSPPFDFRNSFSASAPLLKLSIQILKVSFITLFL